MSMDKTKDIEIPREGALDGFWNIWDRFQFLIVGWTLALAGIGIFAFFQWQIDFLPTPQVRAMEKSLQEISDLEPRFFETELEIVRLALEQKNNHMVPSSQAEALFLVMSRDFEKATKRLPRNTPQAPFIHFREGLMAFQKTGLSITRLFQDSMIRQLTMDRMDLQKYLREIKNVLQKSINQKRAYDAIDKKEQFQFSYMALAVILMGLALISWLSYRQQSTEDLFLAYVDGLILKRPLNLEPGDMDRPIFQAFENYILSLSVPTNSMEHQHQEGQNDGITPMQETPMAPLDGISLESTLTQETLGQTVSTSEVDSAILHSPSSCEDLETKPMETRLHWSPEEFRIDVEKLKLMALNAAVQSHRARGSTPLHADIVQLAEALEKKILKTEEGQKAA